MEKNKVKFHLEKVYNFVLDNYEIKVCRDGLEPQYFAMAKKDICLVTVVANALACQFDNANLANGESVEFELTMKVNRK